MGNTERRFGLLNRNLRSDPASPEHWNFVFFHPWRRAAKYWLFDIVDAEYLWQSNMDWRSMHVWKPASYLNSSDRDRRLEWEHRDDGFTMEAARRFGLKITYIHCDALITLKMSERNVISQQCILEGIGTAEREGDEIIAPIFRNVVRNGDFFAVLENSVAWKVGAEI